MQQTLSANVNNTLPNVAFNDIYLDAQGNISMSTGIDSIVQQCSQAARTILNEMVLYQGQGLPYFETVFIGVPNEQQFASSLRLAISLISGVTEIISLITSQVFTSSPNNRTQTSDTLQYTAIIRTIYGIGTITNG